MMNRRAQFRINARMHFITFQTNIIEKYPQLRTRIVEAVHWRGNERLAIFFRLRFFPTRLLNRIKCELAAQSKVLLYLLRRSPDAWRIYSFQSNQFRCNSGWTTAACRTVREGFDIGGNLETKAKHKQKDFIHFKFVDFRWGTVCTTRTTAFPARSLQVQQGARRNYRG